MLKKILIKSKTTSLLIALVMVLTISFQPQPAHSGGGGGGSDGGGGEVAQFAPGGGTHHWSSGGTQYTSQISADGGTAYVHSSGPSGNSTTIGYANGNQVTIHHEDGGGDQYGGGFQPAPSAAFATLTTTSCQLGLNETICQQPITLGWTSGNTDIRNLFQGNTEIRRGIPPSGSQSVDSVNSNNRTFHIAHSWVIGYSLQQQTTLATRTAPIECLAGVPSGNTCVCPTGQFPNSDNTDCVSFVIPDITFAPDRKLVRIGDTATLNIDVTVNQGATIECAVSPATRVTSANPQSHIFTAAGTHIIAFTTGPINNLSSFSVECYDTIDDASTRVPASTSVEVVPRTQEL